MEKIVRMSFVIGGLLVWVVLAGFFGMVLGWISPNLDKSLIGAQFSVSNLLGLLGGIAVVGYLWLNEKIFKIGMEIAGELRNVTWPKWAETRTSTIVVVITTVVIAAVLGLFDAIVGAVTAAIYGL